MRAGWPPEEDWEILDLDLREEFHTFSCLFNQCHLFPAFKVFSTFLPWELSVVLLTLPENAMLELWTWNRAQRRAGLG